MKNTKNNKKFWIGTMGILFAVILLGVFLIKNYDRMPRTIDKKTNGEYSIELQALGSPAGTFGPQDGRVVLKFGRKTIAKETFVLRNDGKSMDKQNWNVDWDTDQAIVKIVGEEQEDEIITIPLNQ